MKPLLSETQDNDKLQELGRASIQIVHDLKNQLNGLKLYATFLRRRLEKAERPGDELETIAKLIAGLERAANDLSSIVTYGKPLVLKKEPRIDLKAILTDVWARLKEEQNSNGTSLSPSVTFDSGPEGWFGDFDSGLLSEAFKSISLGAIKMAEYRTDQEPIEVCSRSEISTAGASAIIEWCDVNHSDHDQFRSFTGSHGIRLSLAAKIIEAHGGTATCDGNSLVVKLPLLT